jgi:hypothetical protein
LSIASSTTSRGPTEGTGLDFDSAEKPSVHPSRASGRTEERWKSFGVFPFMLSLVEAFIGFFSRIDCYV